MSCLLEFASSSCSHEVILLAKHKNTHNLVGPLMSRNPARRNATISQSHNFSPCLSLCRLVLKSVFVRAQASIRISRESLKSQVSKIGPGYSMLATRF